MTKKKKSKKQKEPSKRRSPTLLDKLIILTELDADTSKHQIARTYNIPRPTIREIEKNRAKIIDAFEKDVPMETRKHIMEPHHPNLEEQLYEWIERKRKRDKAILSYRLIQVSFFDLKNVVFLQGRSPPSLFPYEIPFSVLPVISGYVTVF